MNKAHPSMGDSTLELETWNPPQGLQAAQWVREFPLKAVQLV